MKIKIYLVVTNDKYELPLAIFDTLKDAAKWFGTSNNGVSCMIVRGTKGNKAKFKVLKLLI